MNHRHIVDLANVIHNIRPDWDQPGIVAQLKTCLDGWPGNTQAFYVHAITTATNPMAKTPGAINAKLDYRPPLQSRGINESTCKICYQPQNQCQRRYDFELRRGIPDPHEFEAA